MMNVILNVLILCTQLRLTSGGSVAKGEACETNADCVVNSCTQTYTDLDTANSIKCAAEIPVSCINKICVENSCGSVDGGKTFGGKSLKAYAEGGSIGSSSVNQLTCNSGESTGREYGPCSCDGTTYWDSRDACGCQSCTAGNGCVIHECEENSDCAAAGNGKPYCYKEDITGKNIPNICVECTKHAECTEQATGNYCSAEGKCETGCGPLSWAGWTNDAIQNTEYTHDRDLPCKHVTAKPFCCIHNYRSMTECVDTECSICRGSNFNNDCPRGKSCIKNADDVLNCLECATDSHCERDPSKPRCENSECVAGCQTNAHCPSWAGDPICDTTSSKCVQCEKATDCHAMWGDSAICNAKKCGFPETTADKNTGELSSSESSSDGGYGYGYGEETDDATTTTTSSSGKTLLPSSGTAIAIIEFSTLDFQTIIEKAQNSIVYRAVELTLLKELDIESTALNIKKCDAKKKVCFLTKKDGTKTGIRAAFQVDVTNVENMKMNQLLTDIKRFNAASAIDAIKLTFDNYFDMEVKKYIAANPSTPSAANSTIDVIGSTSKRDPMMIVYIIAGSVGGLLLLCGGCVVLIKKGSKDKVAIDEDDDYYDDDGNPVPTVSLRKPTAVGNGQFKNTNV